MAEVIIKLNDSADGKEIQIEVHSSKMTDETSASNAVAEFLGASWDSVMQGAKMYAEAIRQAREAKKNEEATGVIAEGDTPSLILESNPKILTPGPGGVYTAGA